MLPDKGICAVNDVVKGLDASWTGTTDGGWCLVEQSLLQLHALEAQLVARLPEWLVYEQSPICM